MIVIDILTLLVFILTVAITVVEFNTIALIVMILSGLYLLLRGIIMFGFDIGDLFN